MIAIGCDHGGYELKQKILAHLRQRRLEYRDFGCDSTASVDYPVYGKAVAHAVASGECEKGIVICSTGIGISISANKVKGIRAALCGDCYSAEMTRRHNDANILAMGARVLGPGLALKIVDTFLTTEFEGGRHARRIALISDIDSYNESADQVVLMTIHSAKGLEFPYVFLIGMEEGVFPSEMSKYSEADLEEERRLAYVGITRAKKELYISNSVSRMLYGRTQRNEPSRFLREIEPEYIEETRSPALERRSSMGWGSSYSDTVPGGASGYSGASGWGRNSSSFGGRTGGSYLNREYNASERGGFGSGYAGRGSSTSGFGSGSSAPRTSGSSGFGVGYGRPAAPKAASKPVSFPGSPAASRPASTGPKHYEVGDIVEHKVFGRGRVLAVKAAAGDQIVEINFEKVGVKKTMANFAPLTKITEE